MYLPPSLRLPGLPASPPPPTWPSLARDTSSTTSTHVSSSNTTPLFLRPPFQNLAAPPPSVPVPRSRLNSTRRAGTYFNRYCPPGPFAFRRRRDRLYIVHVSRPSFPIVSLRRDTAPRLRLPPRLPAISRIWSRQSSCQRHPRSDQRRALGARPSSSTLAARSSRYHYRDLAATTTAAAAATTTCSLLPPRPPPSHRLASPRPAVVDARRARRFPSPPATGVARIPTVHFGRLAPSRPPARRPCLVRRQRHIARRAQTASHRI